MTGDAYPDDDHVARCKPSSVDGQGMPMGKRVSASLGEQHLSIQWLEHGGTRGIEAAIRQVRSGLPAAGTEDDYPTRIGYSPRPDEETP